MIKHIKYKIQNIAIIALFISFLPSCDVDELPVDALDEFRPYSNFETLFTKNWRQQHYSEYTCLLRNKMMLYSKDNKEGKSSIFVSVDDKSNISNTYYLDAGQVFFNDEEIEIDSNFYYQKEFDWENNLAKIGDTNKLYISGNLYNDVDEFAKQFYSPIIPVITNLEVEQEISKSEDLIIKYENEENWYNNIAISIEYIKEDFELLTWHKNDIYDFGTILIESKYLKKFPNGNITISIGRSDEFFSRDNRFYIAALSTFQINVILVD